MKMFDYHYPRIPLVTEETIAHWIAGRSDGDIEFLVRVAIYYSEPTHEKASKYWKLFQTVVLGFCEAMRKP